LYRSGGVLGGELVDDPGASPEGQGEARVEPVGQTYLGVPLAQRTRASTRAADSAAVVRLCVYDSRRVFGSVAIQSTSTYDLQLSGRPGDHLPRRESAARTAPSARRH
jgi:hypothetical protein